MFLIEHPHTNSTFTQHQPLYFSRSGCFRCFTLLLCIKSIKYRSYHFIQWFLALLSVTIVLLTSLCLLSSRNCCGLLVSFWINGFALKMSEFGTIVKSGHFDRIKDKVSDILYSNHCQQLRPKSFITSTVGWINVGSVRLCKRLRFNFQFHVVTTVCRCFG